MPDAGPSVSPAPSRRTLFWPAAAIFAATLAAYLPLWRSGLVWNDDKNLTGAALRSWHGLVRLWFSAGATRSYAPVLHSVFWLEHRLWGDAPLGYHLANLFLHAAAACLFARVLVRLSIPGAWLAALIFALHPICVESVAWISEQGNPLSTAFYLLAALACLRFDREREPGPYFAGLGFFALALLSESATATLPAALLIVAWWRRGRLSWWQDVVPLLPFFALGAGVASLNSWVEHARAGAAEMASALTTWDRYLLAGRAFWFYADKLLWPVNLIFVYPRWTVNAAAAWQYAFPLGIIALLLVLWRWRDSARGPLAAVLFFILSLFPHLAFFSFSSFQFSWVADPFLYLASLGIIALAAAAFVHWCGRMPPPAQWSGHALIALLALVLGGLTWRQSRAYRDPPTFYQAILARNPDAWMAHYNLGILRRAAGDLPEAIAQLQAAAKLNPDDVELRDLLGAVLAGAGRLPEAIGEYEAALEREPASAKIQNELGDALIRSGRPADALEHCQEAARLEPEDAVINFNLGRALFLLGRAADAIEPYQRALAAKPDYPEAHNSLGGAFTAVDRLPEAIREYQEAARLKPDYLEAHFNLGIALLQLGQAEKAKVQFDQVLGIDPDYRPARDALDRLAALPPN